MTVPEYYLWLKSLKPGDKIAYGPRFVSYYNFAKVKKITPKGAIRLDNGDLIDSTSGIRKISDTWDDNYRIVPITQGILDINERYNLVVCLSKQKWEYCTLEEMRKIKEILGDSA